MSFGNNHSYSIIVLRAAVPLMPRISIRTCSKFIFVIVMGPIDRFPRRNKSSQQTLALIKILNAFTLINLHALIECFPLIKSISYIRVIEFNINI